MNPIASAVLKAGLVDQKMFDELKRWGSPIELPEVLPEPSKSLTEAAQIIEEALQSEGYVLTRETDLEILGQYMATQRTGKLHVEVVAVPDMLVGTEANFDISYGKTPLGEYIIGWRSESIKDEMTNGLTYLIEDGNHIFFKDVREVFYGDTKAFMICTLSTSEPGAINVLERG